MKFSIPPFVLVAFLSTARASPMVEVPELAAAFRAVGVKGTFVLRDAGGGLHGHDKERAGKRFIPASTFKIANSLIGLECAAVANIDEVLPYGGKPQMFEIWENDMSLRQAIAVSNVPVYQELARRIGPDRMKAGLKRLNYGNMEMGGELTQFWLDGPLEISAIEQVEFLYRLAAGKLDASAEAMAAVWEITKQDGPAGVDFHGKTGAVMTEAKPDIGWYVGWIGSGGSAESFALNIDITGKEDMAKRVPLAKECLRLLGRWSANEIPQP